MTRFLIDADSAIYAMGDAESPVNRRIAACSPGDIAISSISFSEIALGSNLQKPPPPDVLAAFVRVIPVMPYDEAAGRAYAQLPFRRARFDRLLAAHALSVNAIIVTNNVADFADVPGLVIENWTQ